MTLLRVLLLSITFLVSVHSFPSTIPNYEESTTELETKKTTDPIPVHTEDPQTISDTRTNSEGESSIVEFVLNNPKEDSSVRKGSSHEKYTIGNLPAKNEDINLLDSSKDNEIDIDGKDDNELNITGISKNEDLLSEAQIKRDQWLFDPQETSSITGGMPKYFYDAIKPIPPFPELSEVVQPIHPFPESRDTVKPIHPFPALTENSKPIQDFYDFLYKMGKSNETSELVEDSYERSFYESLELGGPRLYPKPAITRDIDGSIFRK